MGGPGGSRSCQERKSPVHKGSLFTTRTSLLVSLYRNSKAPKPVSEPFEGVPPLGWEMGSQKSSCVRQVSFKPKCEKNDATLRDKSNRQGYKKKTTNNNKPSRLSKNKQQQTVKVIKKQTTTNR